MLPKPTFMKSFSTSFISVIELKVKVYPFVKSTQRGREWKEKERGGGSKEIG